MVGGRPLEGVHRGRRDLKSAIVVDPLWWVTGNQPGSLQRVMEGSWLQEGSRTEWRDFGGCRQAVRSPTPGMARSSRRDVGALETAALIVPERRGAWERREAVNSPACLSLHLVVIKGNMEGLLWWLRR